MIFGNNVRYFFSIAYVQYVKFEGTPVASLDLNTFGVFGVIIKEKPIKKITAAFSNPWKDGRVDVLCPKIIRINI